MHLLDINLLVDAFGRWIWRVREIPPSPPEPVLPPPTPLGNPGNGLVPVEPPEPPKPPLGNPGKGFVPVGEVELARSERKKKKIRDKNSIHSTLSCLEK